MWDVGCGMGDVECGMWDVGCGMWNVGCGMWDVGIWGTGQLNCNQLILNYFIHFKSLNLSNP